MCWYTPIKRGKSDLINVQYLNAKFSAECSTRMDTQDEQSGHKAVKRVADWIDLDTIVVVFSHLFTGGKIQKRVQQKMLEDPVVSEAVGLTHLHVEA